MRLYARRTNVLYRELFIKGNRKKEFCVAEWHFSTIHTQISSTNKWTAFRWYRAELLLEYYLYNVHYCSTRFSIEIVVGTRFFFCQSKPIVIVK